MATDGDFKFILAGEIFTGPEGDQYAIRSSKGGYDFYGSDDFEPMNGAPDVPARDEFVPWVQSLSWPPEYAPRMAERRAYLASRSRVRA
jgi:hypothetical protein